MNTKDLLKVLKSKDRLSHISKLLHEKKYEEIYSNYGQTIYTLVVPRKYKKSDINKLLSEGKFEDIYQKYGSSTYNSLLSKMREAEVYYETGSKPKSIFSRMLYSLKHKVAPIFLSATLLLPSVAGATLNIEGRKDVKENSITYAEEIEKYNTQIKEYASEVKKLNLTDLQIIMKVVSDMWEKIDGYARPDETIFGYERLSFLDTPSVGVCQHMADDTTAILNEINPDFHARNMTVYMSDDINPTLANIERTVVENEADSQENEDDSKDNDVLSNIVENSVPLIGNHVVTVVDMPNENVTLIVDPTNPSIGIYADGKIYMFSTEDGTGLSPRPLSAILFRAASAIDVTEDYFKSFIKPEKSIEELESIYGIDALNRTLQEIQQIEENSKKSSFDEKYKLDPSQIHKSETSEAKEDIKTNHLDNQDVR